MHILHEPLTIQQNEEDPEMFIKIIFFFFAQLIAKVIIST